MESSRYQSLVVDARHGGERLDVFLSKSFPTLSRSRLQRAIDQEAVLLNGVAAAKRTAVRQGDHVAIESLVLRAHEKSVPLPEEIPLDVLYEDEHLLAVNKPAGLVVHPGSGNREGTLVNALLYRGGPLSEGSESDRPGIVHRLDKDTSGVLIVARTNRAHAAMSVLFATRKVEKEYAGICIGTYPAQHGLVDAPLGRSRNEPVKRAVRRGGKEALTEYWLLAHEGGMSVLRFRLHSGRTHQIRVHCRHAGFPIVADSLYGGSSMAIKRLQPMERPFAHRVFHCFERHALHARRLAFEHPVTEEPISITAPFPEDFRAALKEFGMGESDWESAGSSSVI